MNFLLDVSEENRDIEIRLRASDDEEKKKRPQQLEDKIDNIMKNYSEAVICRALALQLLRATNKLSCCL